MIIALSVVHDNIQTLVSYPIYAIYNYNIYNNTILSVL